MLIKGDECRRLMLFSVPPTSPAAQRAKKVKELSFSFSLSERKIASLCEELLYHCKMSDGLILAMAACNKVGNSIRRNDTAIATLPY